MKKLQGICKAKTGFSAVIAALILMLLAVAAGVVVYAYVMGWIGGATGHEAGQYGELSVDSMSADGTTDIITVYLRNVGGKSVTPSRAYVNDSNVTSISSSPANIDSNVVASVTINATTPGLTKNVTYEVKIVCTDGTAVTYSIKAK